MPTSGNLREFIKELPDLFRFHNLGNTSEADLTLQYVGKEALDWVMAPLWHHSP